MVDFKSVEILHTKAIQSVFSQTELLKEVTQLLANSLANNGKILWCGNGGSAADAQHMAAELMVRYRKNRAPLASIALTTDTSILTAHSNDFEFETVFSRQVEALGKPNDVLMAISTSGTSANIIKAVEQAKSMNILTIALTGCKNSEIAKLTDRCFYVDALETARIQEGHTLISHLLCEGLDEYFAD
jgi:D-sedoheptulose 7-phosphate isomerase